MARSLMVVLFLVSLVVGCSESPKNDADVKAARSAEGKVGASGTASYAAGAKCAEVCPTEMIACDSAALSEPQPGSPPNQTAGEFNTEAYDKIDDNPFLAAQQNPLSTFSIDVDTASYSNLRRFLHDGALPPKGSVRIEELVNYFPYAYSPPDDGRPFAARVEMAQCPWKPEHRLVRIGIKGKEVSAQERPAGNLVFLLDVSGSMNDANKLPLLKSAMKMLVENLTERDRVAIAVYAGAAGLVLPSTSCETKTPILDAIDRLQSGGSTAGGAGIQLAYKVAQENYIAEHINRVILCTDGDFNVGTTNQSDLVDMIEEKAKGGVFLTVLGFGMGNYKDSTLEKLADKGNGNYGYVDTLNEARKLLVEQVNGTLVTIAKDVKIQVEFNPAKVAAYRLIGYENRMLKAEDFNNDKKDAGEIGAGHTVTALYQVVPVGQDIDLPKVDPLKYQKVAESKPETAGDELLTVKIRYKDPNADTSQLISFPVSDAQRPITEASEDFRFATSVACLGMTLRESPHKGTATLDMAAELARSARGDDPSGYRNEYLQLVELAKQLGRR